MPLTSMKPVMQFQENCLALLHRGHWGRMLSVAALALMPLYGGAQPASGSAAAPQDGPSFVIRGFEIVGESPLSSADVSRVLAQFLRINATQEVGGVVKLNIVKFLIGTVSIDGRQTLSEANIRASVPELAEGTAPNFRTLAVQTAIANESQAKRIQVALKESQEADKIDARIVVTEARPWNFSATASNTGSSATGNDRLTLAAGHANLFDSDHQLTLAFTTSLERPAAAIWALRWMTSSLT